MSLPLDYEPVWKDGDFFVPGQNLFWVRHPTCEELVWELAIAAHLLEMYCQNTSSRTAKSNGAEHSFSILKLSPPTLHMYVFQFMYKPFERKETGEKRVSSSPEEARKA
jgi:hypothetical protein